MYQLTWACIRTWTHTYIHEQMYTHAHTTHLHTCTHTWSVCWNCKTWKHMGNKNSEAKNIMRTKLSLSLSFHLYDDLELENQISFISSHFLYFVRSEIVNQLIGNVDKNDRFIDTNGFLFHFLNKCCPLPYLYIARIRKRWSRGQQICSYARGSQLRLRLFAV